MTGGRLQGFGPTGEVFRASEEHESAERHAIHPCQVADGRLGRRPAQLAHNHDALCQPAVQASRHIGVAQQVGRGNSFSRLSPWFSPNLVLDVACRSRSVDLRLPL